MREAKWLESHGCDAIIAQGFEAGGHRGMFLETDIATQAGLFALLPQVRDAVSVPVVAAGGIADARGSLRHLRLARQVCNWVLPTCPAPRRTYLPCTVRLSTRRAIAGRP